MPSLPCKKADTFLPEDGQLWNMVIKNEISGLEGLYVKYADELFKLGMTIRSNRSLIHDCIQDVFVDISLYRGTIKVTDNVKRYLIKCLRNKIHYMSMSFLFGHESNAQIKDIEEVKINLNVKNVSVEKAMETIEKRSGFRFVYTVEEMVNIPKVTVGWSNQVSMIY